MDGGMLKCGILKYILHHLNIYKEKSIVYTLKLTPVRYIYVKKEARKLNLN